MAGAGLMGLALLGAVLNGTEYRVWDERPQGLRLSARAAAAVKDSVVLEHDGHLIRLARDQLLPQDWEHVEQLKLPEQVPELPWAGVKVAAVTEATKEAFARHGIPGPKVERAVVVLDVLANSPAKEVGVRPLDVIALIDGESVTSEKELNDVIRKHKTGDRIRFRGYRAVKIVSRRTGRVSYVWKSDTAALTLNRQPVEDWREPPSRSSGERSSRISWTSRNCT